VFVEGRGLDRYPMIAVYEEDCQLQEKFLVSNDPNSWLRRASQDLEAITKVERHQRLTPKAT